MEPQQEIFTAVQSGARDRVEALLDAHPAEINATDGSGLTPLALAASTHNDILMIQLLERGARAG